MKPYFFFVLLVAFVATSPFATAAQQQEEVLTAPTPVSIFWTDNSNNEDGFGVERNSNDGPWTLLTKTAANTTHANDDTLQQDPGRDNRYCYRAYAFNSGGESGRTNEVCVVVKRPVPADPSDLLIKLQQALNDVLQFSRAPKQ